MLTERAPDPYKAAAEGPVMSADPGQGGAGVAVRTAVKPPPGVDERRRPIDDQAHNRPLPGLLCIGERAMAVPTGRWRVLHHTTMSPSKSGMIVQAASALTNTEKQIR